jgi:integrase
MPRPRNDAPHLEWRRDTWYITWWEGGVRRRISAKTRNEIRARQALADFESQLEHHPLKLNVADALERYVAARDGKVMALDRLKDAATALLLGLGHLRVDQLNQGQWDRYAATRVTRPPRNAKPGTHVPRPISTSTLRREFNVLRAALRKAWKDGFLLRPPALEAPVETAPRDRYLTKAEAKRLLEACISAHVRAFMALAIYTGARKGSILALTWDRVDFRTGMIDFQEPGRQLTGKRRAIVPMGASLRAELEEAHRSAQGPFVVQYNGHAVPHGLRWSFARLCVRAGLTWQPTPHHLKHSVASWMAMENVPIDQAADWLATDPRTLRRVYRKFDPAYLRSVAGALEL